MTQGDPSPVDASTSTTTAVFLTTTSVPDQEVNQNTVDQDDSPSLTDKLAAITIAVLACILVITLMLIVRAIRKRRRRERGQELNQIPTVSAGIMGANVSAYGPSSSPRPARGVISWEPVTPSTSNANIMASPSVSGVPSSC